MTVPDAKGSRGYQKWTGVGEEGWMLRQDSYSAEDEGFWETVFALSNGWYGCRGNLELASSGRGPGVYLAGVYDKPDVPDESDAFGLVIQNKAVTPAYAVAPVWNVVEIDVGGAPVDFLNSAVVDFRRTLDMQRGLLRSTYELRDRNERTTRLSFVSAALLASPHLYAQVCEITPLDYEAVAIAVRFCCEQPTRPQYIPRLKDYVSHTAYTGLARAGDRVSISGRVEQTGTEIALASWGAASEDCELQILQRECGAAHEFRFVAGRSKAVRFDRLCAVAHNDRSSELVPVDCAVAELERAIGTGVEGLLEEHVATWARKWEEGDVGFDGDERLQQGIRWNLFSLHQLGHFHSPAWSISATGLHGQGYFGHVFWDTDIYMLPFYVLTRPETARDLLLYRAERLDAARQVAREHGFRGAKFPWTSTRDGRDVCPPDWERCGKRQIHISGDIAYAFRMLREWTGDYEFFARNGVEVVVETARFFLSRTQQDAGGELHLLDVIGPDEYNIHADDNFYTNFLAQWNLRYAVEAMAELRERRPDLHADLARRIDWSEEEAETLRDAADRIAFPRLRDGVWEQYAGFFDLKDIGEIKRDENNMPVEKLHAYDKGYQIIKQADAVMTLFLFPDEFPANQQRNTFEYYEKRNSFGSSLSASISCIMGLRLGLPDHAYSYFRLTSLLDVDDLHLDKNTNEGVHAACAGGAAACAFLGYAGVSVRDGLLHIAPTCPRAWSEMTVRFRFRGRTITVVADPADTQVRLTGDPLDAVVHGRPTSLRQPLPV